MGPSSPASRTEVRVENLDQPRVWQAELVCDSFSEWDIAVGGVTLHGRSAGTGPPVALLHGHPRTHYLTPGRAAPGRREFHDRLP